MITRKINELVGFVRSSYRMLAHQKLMIAIFFVLSVMGALSEGITISMLVPILESQANKSLFSEIPILNGIASIFEGMEQSEKLKTAALILGFVLMLRGVMLYFIELLASIIPLRLQRGLYSKGYRSLLHAELDYILEKSVGDHINGLVEWTQRVTVVLTSMAAMTYNVILVVVYLTLMLVISWKMALITALFVSVLSIILKSVTANPLHRVGGELSQRDAKLNQTIHETMVGMKFIKLSALEGMMESRLNDHLGKRIQSLITTRKFQSLSSPFMITCAGLFVCALLFGSSYVEDGIEEWLSALLLFLFLLMRLLSPIMQINVARMQIFANYFAFEMLENFFRETEERKQPTGNIPFEGIRQGIKLDNISFKYPSSNENAIDGFSMDVSAGQMVAIVGPSGSGKSTLVSLLTRFYDPQSGAIKIDGTDLREFDISDLRNHTSVVSQDIFIFNDTVANNLSFSLEGITEDDIRAACKLAAADEFISALPEGYDTMLGDRGVRLSGGQQQRIAIARAILRNPDLLILDEATSHLDTFTEKAIQDAVEALRKDRTVIVIAHRLSTIRRADKVIVVKDGRVIEEGTHKDLIAEKGMYWDMLTHQNIDLVDEEDAMPVEAK